MYPYRDKISKFSSEPDDGVYDAMNKGVRLSTGNIVATLNSDDVYADRNIVSEMAKFMQSKKPNVQIRIT